MTIRAWAAAVVAAAAVTACTDGAAPLGPDSGNLPGRHEALLQLSLRSVARRVTACYSDTLVVVDSGEVIRLAGGPPNKRLKLAARVD